MENYPGEPLSQSANQSPQNVEDSSIPSFPSLSLEGIPCVGVQPLPSMKELSTESLVSSTKIANDLSLQMDDPKTNLRKKYEFSYLYQGEIHICTLWDTNLLSACERVLCEPVSSERIQTSKSGNHFLVSTNGTHWAVKISPWMDSTKTYEGMVHPSELRTEKHNTIKSEPRNVLDGLL